MHDEELLEVLEEKLRAAKQREMSFAQAAEDAADEVRSLEAALTHARAAVREHEQFNAAAARLIDDEKL